MQPTGPTATPPQQDLLKTMQPPPQQLIMSTNKKKKYAQQPPPTQQQTQHQYQINKSFNTMSILKTSTNQQQQQTQNYVNVSNRSLQGICSGNVVAVNNCQISTANAATLFGLNHHGVGGGSGNASAIDSNQVTTSQVYGNTSVGGSAVGVNATVCNVGAPSNTGHGSGGVGLTIGTAATNSSFTHENGSVNTSSVNVGGCIDNRKYDIQLKNNNKLLNNNSFQTPSEFPPSSGGSNGSSNIRPNQQTTTIYRGPPTSTQPRSGARHVPLQMYQQHMHQNVVMPSFPPFQRQPAYQSPQYTFTPTMNAFFSSYPYYQPMQQQPTHPRGPVGVNPSVGVNVGSGISVQPGPNGPPGASQAQMPVPPGSNAVLGVTSPGPGQQQVGIGMPSMVGVPVPNVASTQSTQNKGRVRSHALPIIDPDTQRPIVMDKPKNVSNSDLENQEVNSIPVMTPDVQMIASQQQSDLPSGRPLMLQIEPDNRTANIFNIDVHQMQRDVTGGQTPVVSAKSDAPSIEIRPTSQNPRNKKIISSAPLKDEQNKSQSFGKSAEEINKAHQPTKKIDDLVNLVNVQPLPQNSQVPHDSQLEPNQHSSIQTTQLELIHSNTSLTIAPQETNIQLPKDSSSGGGCTNTTNQTTADNQIIANTYNYISTDSNFTDTDPDIISQICHIGNSSNSFIDPLTKAVREQNTSIPPEEVESSFKNMKLNEQETATVATTISTNPFIETTDTSATNGSGEENVTQITVHVQESPALTSPSPLPSLSLPKAEFNNAVTLTGSVSMTEDKLDVSDAIDSDNISSVDIAVNDVAGDETDRMNVEHMSSATDTPKDPHLLGKGLEINTIEPTSSIASPTNGKMEMLSSTINSEITAGSVSVSTTNTTATTTETTNKKLVIGPPPLSIPSAGTSSTGTTPALINYNEGQWSPQNPMGKRQYDRDQLLQLRDAKASRIQPEVNNVSIMSGSDNLMPSFARGNNNKGRSAQSMAGSMGGGSRGGGGDGISKQASMSGINARNSTKGEKGDKKLIHINLSLNQDVKLNETDNAWRPSVLVGSKDSEIDPSIRVQREKDDLIRRVRGILNKLTPEKFDALVEEIIKLKIDSPDKVEDVMVLVFEKAIDEPSFSVSYARLCQRLVMEVKAQDERMESGTKTNLAAFRSALLDKTEREFTQNVTQRADREKKLQPIMEKIKATTDPAEKTELQALLEEEERKIRRRSGGTVRFIGELFKISMLTGKIIYHCIEKLLDPKHEDLLECLCKLLTTVGAKYEQTTTKDSKGCYSLEKTIDRMQAIASKADKEGARVSSRVRFMLQDVIDLRTNKWQSSRNEGPKTMGQIDKEAKTEQLSSQYLNYGGILSGSGSGNQNSGKRDDRLGGGGRFNDSRPSGGYGGSHSQRGDTGSLRRQQQSGISGNTGGGGNNISGGNNDDNTWHTIPNSKGSRSQAVDTNKLECLLNQNLDMGSKKMGGLHQFIWNSAQRQSAPTSTASNSFAVLSSFVDTNKSINDRDRDRGGPRNKGSYNKGSMERDRYNDRGIQSRTGSSQGSRENSSSRGNQSGRGLMMGMGSSMQKSASHKNYSQPMTPRMSGKSSGLASMSSASALHPHHRGDQTQQPTQQRSSDSSNTSFPSAPPAAVFEEPTVAELNLMKSVVSELLEIAASSKTITTAIVPCINRIKERQHCGLLYYILTDYLHLHNVGQQHRRYIANIVVFLIKHKFISVDHFRLAYEQFCNIASDLIYDVPDMWLYIFEFTGPLITKQILTIKDLWTKRLQDDESPKLGQKFLKTYLVYCTREIGVRFTREMWEKCSMKWTDFMPESEVQNFIQANKFEYVENEGKQPEIIIKDSKEKHISKVVDRVEHLLSEGSDHDAIIDYINGNIVDVDKQFIRSLTTVVSNFAINFKDESYKLDTDSFVKVGIPVLHRYIDQKEERELECLYAMQFLVNSLEHPRGLLNDLFVELYDNYVIFAESFIKWRDSKDQSAGKGVAVKGLNQFFNQLASGETSEENN